jgi:hypothetical protein
MTDKALKNLYPRLRPDERFRLALEAAARGDMDEFELLSGSCPVHVYYARDRAYTSRGLAAGFVVLSFANLLFRAEIDLARQTGEGPTIEAGGDWSECAPGGELHELDDLYRERVAAVLGICEGLERFCDALGLEPAKLLAIDRSFLPAWQSAGRLRGKGIASDPAMAEAVHKFLEGLWSGMVDDQESERQGFIER